MGLPLLPSDFDVSVALADDRDERFAQLRVVGVSLRRSFELTHLGAANPKSVDALRQLGWRKGNQPTISARVEWLRANPAPKAVQTVVVPAPPPAPPILDRAGLLGLMGEVTEALSTAARTLSQIGSNPKTISRLRADLIVHVRRLDRLKPAHIDIEGGDVAFQSMLMNARAQWCSCEHVGGGV